MDETPDMSCNNVRVMRVGWMYGMEVPELGVKIDGGVVRSSQVKVGKVRSGKVRQGKVRSGQVRAGQGWSGLVRSGSGQVRSGKIRSGRVKVGRPKWRENPEIGVHAAYPTHREAPQPNRIPHILPVRPLEEIWDVSSSHI